MNVKGKAQAANAAIDRLRDQLLERMALMPEHWDEIEIGWLAHLAAQNRTINRPELDLRRKAFNNLVRHGKI